MDAYMRRAGRILVHFMALRLLDYRVRINVKMQREFRVRELKDAPNATEWLTLLGDVLHGRHERSSDIMHRLDYLPDELASAHGGRLPRCGGNSRRRPSHWESRVLRLAEGLVALQGRKAQQ